MSKGGIMMSNNEKKNNKLAIEIGAQIAKRRKNIGYTQIQMAQMLGIEQESLSRIEKGVIAPKFSRLENIALILECKVSDLFLSKNDDFESISTKVSDSISHLPKEKQYIALELIQCIALVLNKTNNTIKS